MPDPSLAASRRMRRRIDLPAGLLGVEAPPCPVHLKILPLGARWGVVALPPQGQASAVAQWLKAHGMQPAMADSPALASMPVLRCDLEAIPPEWVAAVASLRLQHMMVGSDGTASLFVDGEPTQVDAWAAAKAARLAQAPPVSAASPPGAESGFHSVRVRGMAPGNVGATTPLVSPRQLDAVSRAVALGYYEIPHRVDLRTVAASMGLSLSALSELLRRAEASIVTSYTDANADGRWNETAAAQAVADLIARRA